MKVGIKFMLDYMEFTIGGFFGGYDTAKICVKDGCINYSIYHEFGPDEEPLLVETKSLKFSKEWLNRLENIHINRWHASYKPPYIVCDGTQWNLEYKVEGKRCRHISGSNAYPENWDDFANLMSELVPFDMQQDDDSDLE